VIAKIQLTQIRANSGKRNNTKVVDYFDIFLASVNTPSDDQWFKSYDLCELEVRLKFSSRQTEISGQIGDLSPLLRNHWENLAYRYYGSFQNFSNEWQNSGF
jgi:hypothetical protein